MRVTVLGASGLVGATFVEHLLAHGRHEVHAIIHTSGNASRLARWGIDLTAVDIRSPDAVRRALAGSTHVANCTGGSTDVRVMGMRNILAACRSCGIERLVHLSSVLVYGERPDPASVHERARPRPSPGYGQAKLRQDRLAQAAVRHGLGVVVLCIPHVSGPYSRYLAEILAAMRQGGLPLVEGGRQPVNLVDARNVAVALEQALVCKEADGRRLFVTDGEDITWRDLVDELAPLAEQGPPWPSLSRAQAAALTRKVGLLTAARRAAGRILQLEEVKAIVGSEEALARASGRLKKSFPTLSGWVQQPSRSSIGRRGAVPAAGTPSTPSVKLIRHQLRGVRHSIARAEAVLGYAPAYGFRSSMASYRAWYAEMYGHGGSFWDLHRQLL
jgi:nucleoside-diphosphate-sugar epimerase